MVNFASPFCVVTFCGRLPPFNCVSEFPELTEMASISDTGANFWLQSSMSTTNWIDVSVEMGGLG